MPDLLRGEVVDAGGLERSHVLQLFTDAAVCRQRMCLKIAVVGSGNSVHVVNRARGLRDAGHDVVLITANRPSVPLHGLRSMFPAPVTSRRFLGWLGVVKHIQAIIRLIDSAQADVVYVHYAGGLAAWLVWACARRPLAVNVMGGDVLYNERGSLSWLGRWLTRRLVRKADLVTSKSAHLTRRLSSLGVQPERIMPVRWGVDLWEFQRRENPALRKEIGIATTDRVIISPRILRPFYNIHLIIEAMPAVLQHIPEAKLLILEYNVDPDYRAQLKRRIDDLRLSDRVQFMGTIQPEQMAEILSIAEVSVGIPESDGMPQSLLESMACEVVPVIGRLSRYEELVRHEESAWFVDFDAQSVADGIVSLFRDNELRQRIAKRGRKIVERDANFRSEVEKVIERLRTLKQLSRRRGLAGRLARWLRVLPVVVNEWVEGYRKRIRQVLCRDASCDSFSR